METDLLKPALFLDGQGNRVCKCKSTPMCRRCGELINKGDTIYFCSTSKNVYCSRCMHSKAHWACPNPNFVEEHIDWMCVLEVAK